MHHRIKSYLRRMFHSLGYEITRRQSPTATADAWAARSTSEGSARHTLPGVLAAVRRLGFRPQTVIDVGAAFGTHPLYQAFPEARHLLIEPLVEWRPNLQSVCDRYDAEHVVAVAGATAGSVEMNVYPYMLGSSILSAAEGGVSRRVPCVRLDDLCWQKSCRGPFVIKVDAEGAELQVIDGALGILAETELVILEAAMFEFFPGCPLAGDLVEQMRTLGFELYDIVDVHYRPLDQAVGKLDLAFARREGLLRDSNNWGDATSEEIERDGWVLDMFRERQVA